MIRKAADVVLGVISVVALIGVVLCLMVLIISLRKMSPQEPGAEVPPGVKVVAARLVRPTVFSQSVTASWMVERITNLHAARNAPLLRLRC